MSEKISINMDKLARLYNDDGLTTMELAEHFNTSERTITRRVWRLRKDGKIKEKKVIPIDRKLNIDKSELLKLLALYKSKQKVAVKLEVSLKVISDLCNEYNILDNKAWSLLLNSSLSDLTSKYSGFKIVNKKPRGDETLMIGLSDWHVGKKVLDYKKNIIYDENIFKFRMEKLLSSMLKIVDYHISKHINLKEVYILCLGDMANDEGIYPTQIYQQEFSPPMQVMLAVEYLFKLIQALIDRGLEVKFRGIKGNHGRLGKDADPSSNWDLMIYMILNYVKKIRDLKKLDIEFSDSDYFPFKIRNWRYLLRHQAYAQDETSAGAAKYLGWQLIHNADTIVSGHTHHWDVNARRIVVGSPVGLDDLSERMAKPEGTPSQLIWLCTDERSHTNIYPVDLKGRSCVK